MISEARLMRILVGPVVSEKSTIAREGYCYVFKVLPDATKAEIAAAAEKIFNTKVLSVNTSKTHGKPFRTRFGKGRRSDWKKAYIAFPEGFEIDFSGPVFQKLDKKESK